MKRNTRSVRWPLYALGACLSVTIAAGAVQAQTLQDFASAVELGVDGKHALYEASVSRPVYEGVVRPDLGDVRVFNGVNEIVPHAFRPRESVQPASVETVKLTPFVLSAPANMAGDGFNARIERDGDRFRFEINDKTGAATERVVGYVLDTTTTEQPIRAMRLDIGAMTGSFASSVRIETSDDLRLWSTVAIGAPIVKLEASGQQLLQDRIEFAPRKAKYWRISWTGERRALSIAGVDAELATGAVEPAREWKEIVAAATGKPGEYSVDSGGRFPADRLRFALPQANTVAVIEVLARNQTSDPWRPIANATVYRLTQDGTEVTSPPVSIPSSTERYWLVRVDQRGGGIGQGELGVSIGWVPHRIVFVARGAAPFQLAFGSARAAPSSYRLDTLMPGLVAGEGAPAGKTLQPGRAQIQGQPAPAPIAGATVQGAVRTIAGDAARAPSTPVKLWALWASIIGGVVVLAWMAWRLSRQLARSAASESAASNTGPKDSTKEQ